MTLIGIGGKALSMLADCKLIYGVRCSMLTWGSGRWK